MRILVIEDDPEAALIEFMKRAFGATEHHVMRGPDGSVWHGDLVIGTSAGANVAAGFNRNFNTGVSLVTDKPVEGVPSISSKEGLAKCWG